MRHNNSSMALLMRSVFTYAFIATSLLITKSSNAEPIISLKGLEDLPINATLALDPEGSLVDETICIIQPYHVRLVHNARGVDKINGHLSSLRKKFGEDEFGFAWTNQTVVSSIRLNRSSKRDLLSAHLWTEHEAVLPNLQPQICAKLRDALISKILVKNRIYFSLATKK
jgi:hypothetical protein